MCGVMDLSAILSDAASPSTSYTAVILVSVIAGLGAYIGTYLRTNGERQAIMETLEKVEGRVADMGEAARERWSRRSEVCARLYGLLMMATREFRSYLSYSTSTKDAIKHLNTRAQEFEDYFTTNALFLPREIKAQVETVANEFLTMYYKTEFILPEKEEIGSGELVQAAENETRSQHYKMKAEFGKRFKDDGDMTKKILHVEELMRKALELDH